MNSLNRKYSKIGCHFMKTLIYLSSLFFIFSCDPRHKEKRNFKLQVAVNSNFRKYLDYPSIPFKRDDSVFYDSVQNQMISVFNSLHKGKTAVRIFSLLTEDYQNTIELQSDSIISFDTTFYSNFTIGDPKYFLNLASSNTNKIFIGQNVSGCFGGYYEKIVIQKDDKFYYVNYRRNNSPELNYKTIIADSLFNRHYNLFISKANKLFPTKFDGWIVENLSTTSIDTYIRVGNIIYELPDIYDWKGYEEFKKSIGINISE